MMNLARTIFIAALLTLTATLFTSFDARAAVIVVNTNVDELNCSSSTLSLREAIEIAQGSLNYLSDNKLAQIWDTKGLLITPNILPPPKTCPFGAILWLVQNAMYSSHTINFANNLGVINIVNSALPDLRYNNIDINGKAPNGSNIILDGTQAGAGATGIALGDHAYNLQNMEIRNFSGDGVHLDSSDNSWLRGLKIHHNGGHGIHITSMFPVTGNSQNVTIGGTIAGQGNVIHSNGADGINITGNTAYDRAFQKITILNSVIGTADGIAAAPNAGNGITLVDTWGVTVGDSSGLTKNTISGNAHDGVQISGAEAVSNAVFWNNIGTDLNGNARLGNGWSGVALLADAGRNVDLVNRFENRIGKPGFPNLISANDVGVYLGGTNTSHNIVQSNLIGTGSGGNTNLGNISQGVYFASGTSDNLIGGTGASEGNLIAFNGAGIFANSGIRNSFKRNRIFSNVYLGIDLAPSGVTPNDLNDADSGPNGLQNFPVVSYVNSQPGSVTLSGSLNSVPSQSFDLEFFGNSERDFTGYGEGRNFLGTTRVTTNASGYAFFNGLSFASTPSTVGSWVTATATDTSGNTSEFSQSVNICQTMSFSPPDALIPVAGGTSSFFVQNSAGCTYSVLSAASWITVNSVLAGTVSYTAAANTGPPRDGYIDVSFNDGTGPAVRRFLVSMNSGVGAATSTLSNISTRGQVQTGQSVMIGGFVIGGTTSKTVLIRARGPSLTPFGVVGALANPTVSLYSGSTPLATNDNWGSAANAAAITATGLAPTNSFDSAILTTLPPGSYTAIVSGVGSTTGLGIVEVLEIDNPASPLSNISTRGQVQTGQNVMIGGFVISGTTSKTVLIRARGPSLTAFGVTGALANPMMDLYSGSTKIDSNDNWGSALNAAAITATGLAPTNALESAILTTLPPGAYTVIVQGVGSTSGVGIMEVLAQ